MKIERKKKKKKPGKFEMTLVNLYKVQSYQFDNAFFATETSVVVSPVRSSYFDVPCSMCSLRIYTNLIMKIELSSKGCKLYIYTQ